MKNAISGLLVLFLIVSHSHASESFKSGRPTGLITPKKLIPVKPDTDYQVEIAITGSHQGMQFKSRKKGGKFNLITGGKIKLPVKTKVRFTATSDDVIHACYMMDGGVRLGPQHKGNKIESHWRMDLISGYENEKVMRFDARKSYTISCLQYERLDKVSTLDIMFE